MASWLRPKPTSKPSRKWAAAQARLIFVLEGERLHAVHLYYRTIELARRDFWHAIRRLRGGAFEREDEPIRVLSD